MITGNEPKSWTCDCGVSNEAPPGKCICKACGLPRGARK